VAVPNRGIRRADFREALPYPLLPSICEGCRNDSNGVVGECPATVAEGRSAVGPYCRTSGSPVSATRIASSPVYHPVSSSTCAKAATKRCRAPVPRRCRHFSRRRRDRGQRRLAGAVRRMPGELDYFSTSIFLGASHDMQMRVGRSSPHDVGSGRLVRGRETGSFRIEGPHNHPMRTYLDGHARGVMGI
jgi:hypothetical protein